MRLRDFLRGLIAICSLFGAASHLHAQQHDPARQSWPQFAIGEQNAAIPAYESNRLPVTNSVASTNYEGEPLQATYATAATNEYLLERMNVLEAELAELRAGKGTGGGSGSSGGISSGHSASKMKIAGRVHVDAWNIAEDSPGVNEIETGNPAFSPQDRIGFRRMRFGVRGSLPSNMDYRIEMEFVGGNNSEFRDAWLGFKELPVLQTILIGNQKRPYGLDHLNSSRYNVFLERPFVIESFNQDARRLGIASYGVSENQRWNWRYGVYNQRLIQDEGNYISDHFQLEFASRLANTIWYDESSGGRGYAHWAISQTWADTDGTGASPPRATNEARFRHRPEARTVSRWLDTGIIAGAADYQLLGAEGVVNVGPVQVVGEYLNVWVDRTTMPQVNLHGGYFYVSYFLTGEHMPWDRKSGTLARIKPFENFFLVDRNSGGWGHGWGAWQVAARYSYADFNDQGIQGGIGDSFTFGVNWYWTPYARLQFNCIIGDIKGRDSNNDTSPPGIPNVVDGHYTILGTRAMVDF